MKFLRKFTQKKSGVFGLGGVRVGEGQGGCERRIEVFCENSKKKLGGGSGVWSGVGLGGVRVNVKEELKFLGKFTKTKSGVGRRGVRWGSGW